MIKRVELKSSDWYQSDAYQSDGLFYVVDPDGDQSMLAMVQDAMVWGGYIWSNSSPVPKWFLDLVDKEDEKGVSEKIPEGKIELSEDLFLKTLAVARGQKISNL